MGISVVSFGGGVQSTAMLVLAAQGELDVKTFLFANVGDDSEHPNTLAYVRTIAMPYAQKHGIELVELRRYKTDGNLETLYEYILDPTTKTMGIPVRLGSGAPSTRLCTNHFKIKIVAKWVRLHGATKKDPALVHLGISMDEFQRMRGSAIGYETLVYPLIERRLSRQDCINIITKAGLPVPGKSSCWFCPYHRISRWQEMAETEPELFAKSVELEKRINEKRRARGKDDVYFTDKLIPLNKAIGAEAQAKFPEMESSCDSGYCFM